MAGWKIPELNEGFNRKITLKLSIFHRHIWLPDGISTYQTWAWNRQNPDNVWWLGEAFWNWWMPHWIILIGHLRATCRTSPGFTGVFSPKDGIIHPALPCGFQHRGHIPLVIQYGTWKSHVLNDFANKQYTQSFWKKTTSWSKMV